MTYSSLQSRKRTVDLDVLFNGDISQLSQDELQAGVALLREHQERLLQQMKQTVTTANENQQLYEELEMRHGGGFAQWVIDDLARFHARQNGNKQ